MGLEGEENATMHATIGAVIVLVLVGVLQVVPVVHFLRVRRLSPCLRSSYCLLYIMLLAMAWMGFILLMELTHAFWVWLLPVLLLPLAFWAFLAATGFRTAGDGASCPIQQ